MKTIQVTTTEEDIRAWQDINRCDACPIIRAISRATNISKKVIIVGVFGYGYGYGYEYEYFAWMTGQWPQRVREWISDLDMNQKVFPITVEVEVPE
jgi:hypothetical protein